jgi:hypothetical protein
MTDIINNSNPTNHRSESDGIFITAEHLKSRLDGGQHLMVLDIGEIEIRTEEYTGFSICSL